MMTYKPPKVIAEIGCNHKGDFQIAKELIRIAKSCGAQVAKFQKRTPKELLGPTQYSSPHPNPYHAYGATYGEHREFLEFNLDQHAELQKYCKKLHIQYSCSVWDLTSTKEIISLNPAFIKVPSAANNNRKLLEMLRDDYKGNIHISLGMTTHKEEGLILDVFGKKPAKESRLVVYSCTSGYPVPAEDTCLLEITRIKKDYGKWLQAVGFSGHHNGINLDIAAYTLGAQWIERHFTKNRTWKGTDHAASLEPTGLMKLVRDLKETYQALHYKPSEILEIEAPQREKLKFKPHF